MSNSDLKEQIKLAQQWHTPRYEIDRELLQAGHNPAEIDLAWAQLEGKVSTPKPLKKFIIREIVMAVSFLIVLGVLFWLVLAYHLSPVLFVTLNPLILVFSKKKPRKP